MYQAPENLVEMNKANIDTAMKFAGIALEGAERMIELQLKAAKAAFADSIQGAKALASVKDLQQFAALNDNLTQPSIEKATAYARSVYDVAAATQAEFNKIVEEQVAEFNKQTVAALDKMVKTAPAGSELGIATLKSSIAAVNSAYDNLSKVGKHREESEESGLSRFPSCSTSKPPDQRGLFLCTGCGTPSQAPECSRP
jgi:phasin family protein